MALVDTHHHVWDLSVRDQPWLASEAELAPLLRNFTLADLKPVAQAAGVTSTVLVQTVIDPAETPDLLALAAASDLVAGVVGWVDLEAPDVADRLAALRALPGAGLLAGIRHPVLAEPDPGWLARPLVLRGLAAVAAAGLVYDIVVQPAQLRGATAAAAAVPQLTFVLDHLGNPQIAPAVDEQWSSAVRDLAALPNTTCKLSGILGEQDITLVRPYYQTVLEAFGPSRMMFGSDWPVSTLSAPYGRILDVARMLTADLSAADRAAIFGETAQRIYGLRDSPAG